MAKKLKKRQVAKEQVTILRTEKIPVDDLKPFHKNPRVGNVDEIAKSLHVNGQFKPIVVNIGTHTGRPYEILAGNHTFYASKKTLAWQLGEQFYDKPEWTHIVASLVDVDDEVATSIVLADNKTAELGTYDDKALAELLADLPTVTGTGFSTEEAESLIEEFATIDMGELEDMMEETNRDIFAAVSDDDDDDDDDEPARPISEREQRREERGEQAEEADAARGVRRAPVEEEEERKDIEEISVAQELQVLLELKEDDNYAKDSTNQWGIPQLRSDKLVQTLPKNLQTWAGRKLTPDDGKTWFLYNYGNGARIDLPFDRTILGFWAFDEKFECWWDSPSYYAAKYITAGVKQAIVPDFSYYGLDPKVMHLHNAYRAQWIGRFLQEAGVDIIPRFQWSLTHENPLDIALLGLPKKIPVLAVQLQNLDNKEEEDRSIEILKGAFKALDVKEVLLYGDTKRANRVWQGVGFKGRTVQLETYFSICKRDRDVRTHKGAAKMTKKQRTAVLAKHGKEEKKVSEYRQD